MVILPTPPPPTQLSTWFMYDPKGKSKSNKNLEFVMCNGDVSKLSMDFP